MRPSSSERRFVCQWTAWQISCQMNPTTQGLEFAALRHAFHQNLHNIWPTGGSP